MPVHSIALDWHAWFSMAAASFVAGVLSYLSCLMALRMAKRHGMIVQPGERQSHELATPTGGGLGLIFSLLVMRPAGSLTGSIFLRWCDCSFS